MIFQDLNNIDQIKRKIFKDFDIDLDQNPWINYCLLINYQNNIWSYKNNVMYIKVRFYRDNKFYQSRIVVPRAFDERGNELDEVDPDWICRQKDNCILIHSDIYNDFYILDCSKFVEFEDFEKNFENL